MMPKQKPGKSKQDYRTPPEFLTAVKKLLNIEEFAWDLAASAENAVCPHYYTEGGNALDASWKSDGWNWLNPPFSKIGPWVEKASMAKFAERASTAVLVPASVGSNWWYQHVRDFAHIHYLMDRITFVGCEDPYPKDCALLLYRPGLAGGESYWDWKLTASL